MRYFVSYTIRDNEVTVNVLNDFLCVLKEYGDVYIDLFHNDSMNKQERVFQEIGACDIFIILESKNVYKSEWVLLEVQRAIEFKKRIIKIPLMHYRQKIKLSGLSIIN